jgi:hypothetical protein
VTTKNFFGKITPAGLSKAKQAAAESVTEHETRLLGVCIRSHRDALALLKSRDE